MVRKVFLAVALLLFTASLLSAMEPKAVKVDSAAEDFTLPDLGHKQVSLSDLTGKPAILFFWTTWCPYCRDELKLLNDSYGKMKKDGTEVLAINVGEKFSRVDSFTKSYKLPFRVLLDEDKEVARSYNVMGVPTYIFIDKSGRIVYRENYFETKIYNQLISQ